MEIFPRVFKYVQMPFRTRFKKEERVWVAFNRLVFFFFLLPLPKFTSLKSILLPFPSVHFLSCYNLPSLNFLLSCFPKDR